MGGWEITHELPEMPIARVPVNLADRRRFPDPTPYGWERQIDARETKNGGGRFLPPPKVFQDDR